MADKSFNKKIDQLSGGYKNDWQNEAQHRLDNKKWLKHSRKIAIKINSSLRSKNIKQKELAQLLEISPQQVSKILKGRENLTLETISKIENVLNIHLLNSDKQKNAEISLKKHFSYTKPHSASKKHKYSETKVRQLSFSSKDFNNKRLCK